TQPQTVLPGEFLRKPEVPRIVNIITMAGKKADPVVEQAEYEHEVFNPYTPITIVPNDYQEE
ncbi:MAG: hypothetical protein IIU64_01440, partial [Alistipes sp.]|nr:hypothetical protein [Alistipes sp.]